MIQTTKLDNNFRSANWSVCDSILITISGVPIGLFVIQTRYSKTPIYRASRGKGFRPGISGGPVNRIVKYTNLHINPVFGEREKAPVNRGARYIGAR